MSFLSPEALRRMRQEPKKVNRPGRRASASARHPRSTRAHVAVRRPTRHGRWEGDGGRL